MEHFRIVLGIFFDAQSKTNFLPDGQKQLSTQYNWAQKVPFSVTSPLLDSEMTTDWNTVFFPFWGVRGLSVTSTYVCIPSLAYAIAPPTAFNSMRSSNNEMR